ncbi:MAG TPA: hypothetical protein VGN57_07415 [Pirellulaceae bacterium]|jgi:hypothetical protein|nr:hypothetical protein [Pirellulaceae bacterium]
MNRAYLRITLILCFAAACFFSGATRATITLAASLALPSNSIPVQTEEEEHSTTGREATESRRQQRVVRRIVKLPSLTAPQSACAATLSGRIGFVLGHRWSNGLLAPLRL